jgi:hypothetical protein
MSADDYIYVAVIVEEGDCAVYGAYASEELAEEGLLAVLYRRMVPSDIEELGYGGSDDPLPTYETLGYELFSERYCAVRDLFIDMGVDTYVRPIERA